MIATDLQAGGGAGNFLEKVSLFAASDLRNATIFGLGIMPYISASIIFSSGHCLSALEELKEGRRGRSQEAERIHRYLTVFICIIQSWMYLTFMIKAGGEGGAGINQNFLNATGDGLYWGWASRGRHGHDLRNHLLDVAW